MTPDDPRHGKVAGYTAGCRNTCCRHAIAVYNQQRLLKALRGEPTTGWIPATGTQRRLQALVALGWSFPRIGSHCGLEPSFLKHVAKHQGLVAPLTADRVARVYDELSMRLPPQNTGGERQGATRARNVAAKHGWLPPLAWDDDTIDDPTAQPAVLRARQTWRNADLIAEYEHPTAAGYSRAQVADRLGITKARLEKALARHQQQTTTSSSASRQETAA